MDHKHLSQSRAVEHGAVRTRLQRLARLLDDAFALPGGYRIGLDGLIGLVPVAGDIVGALLAVYIIVQARRLGVPLRLQGRMLGNVLLELVVGLIPVLGDVFDFAFKANRRNLALIEAHLAQQEKQDASVSVWQRIRLPVLGVLLLCALMLLLFL